jgi:hypothetical protein
MRTSNWTTSPSISVVGEEEPIEIGFDAVAAYHGQAALAMLAVTFQGLRATFAKLSPTDAPRRNSLSVVSGHPGPGVRDAFEFVTRVVTRNAYIVDRSLPEARLNPHGDMSYSFRISLDGNTVQAVLRDNVLPARFFEVGSIKEKSASEAAEYSALKREIAARVLASEPETLFVLKKLNSAN